ncbi:MAG: hypothetical protein ACOVSW_08545 [Candidatus Kapaibacteriota bacterium]|jgi:hypothetical protein
MNQSHAHYASSTNEAEYLAFAVDSTQTSSESSSETNDNSTMYDANGSVESPSPVSMGGHEALGRENILRDIINDDQYQSLRKLGLINEKVLRDVHIRKTFKDLRSQHLSAHQAIERLQNLYPYLQYDTLRKIVYQINDSRG